MVDGQSAKSSLKLEPDHTVLIHPQEPPSTPTLQPEAIPLDIVYENADLLVINKPAGMVVHPAPATLAARWSTRCCTTARILKVWGASCVPALYTGWTKRPPVCWWWPRMTPPTAFCSVNLRRTVYKEYLALVEGRIDPPRAYRRPHWPPPQRPPAPSRVAP
ncbi:MAG: hypothetical protein R2911_31535 [Caldilineaceae bacterium]